MDTLIKIIGIVFPVVGTVVVAIIEKNAAKGRKAAQEQSALREKENRLSMKMINATMQLSIVSANALTNQKNNGNVERARKAAEEAQREYTEFLQEVAAHEVSK